MNLSSLVIPVLLSAVAVYGLGKRVDVYAALTHGAEEGLTVLLRVAPALVGLLTAVSMFRVSGAMEWLSGLFAPVLELLGVPPETAPRQNASPASAPCWRGTASSSPPPSCAAAATQRYA